MAGILIRNYPTTAATFNSDDYGDIDGATSGTRKMLLSVMATQFGLQLASDGMVFGAGSAAAPKLAVGTAGNGIYASAANTLDVTTNGTRAITVTSGQLVGIGVATPAAALHVGTSLTTSPRGIMSAQYSTGTDGARFHMRKARGTATAPTTVVTGDVLGKLVATGYDGSNYLEMASISMEATGTVAATRIPTRLVWATATNAAPSVLTDRLWLSAAGNLGVGTSSETGLTGVGGLVVASTTLGTSGASGALIVGGTGAFGKKCFITDGSTGAQLRLEYTATTVYSDLATLSTGHFLVTTTGGNRITSTTVNDTSVLARQVAGGLALDGLTADTGFKSTIAALGTTEVTLHAIYRVPTSAITSGAYHIGVSANYFTTTAGDWNIRINSTGLDVLMQDGSGYQRWTYNPVTSFAGKLISLTVVRSSATSLIFYINGALTTFTDSASTRDANLINLTATVLRAQCATIADKPIEVFDVKLFNRALSASEVITLSNQGVQEADKWGSLTAIISPSVLNGGFETLGGGGADVYATWTEILTGTGTVVNETVDVYAGVNSCKLNGGASGTAQLYQNAALVAGKYYRVSYAGKSTGGGSVKMRVGGLNPTAQVLTGTWTLYSFDVINTGTAPAFFYFETSSNADVLIDNITVARIGSILDAEFPGVGYQVPDRSSNNYHGVVSATGTSWTLAQRRGQVRATTNTLGDKHIFSQVSLPTNAIITSIVGYTTGTPTVKVGNVSAGSQLVASVAMSASTYTSFTLAAITSTTGNVWVNSSTADTINWTITYMIADP